MAKIAESARAAHAAVLEVSSQRALGTGERQQDMSWGSEGSAGGALLPARSSALDDWPRHLLTNEAVYEACYETCRIDTTSLSILAGTWLHTYWSLMATLESTVTMPLPPLWQRTAEEFGRGVVEVLKRQAEVTPGVARLLLRFVEKFLPYIDWQIALAHCDAADFAEAEENYSRIVCKDPVFLPVIDLRSLSVAQRAEEQHPAAA